MGALSWDIGLAMLSEYDRDGFLGIQVDGYGEEQAGLASYEAHGLLGTLGRPMDPDVGPDGQPIEGMSCQVMYAHEGSKAHAFCLNDPRTLSKLPELLKGEKVDFAPNTIAQFIRYHADGTISMYTTDDGTVDGKTIMRSVDPNPLTGGIVDFCPWGKAVLNSTGYHLATAGGATLDGGGMSFPGLPSALSSYWSLGAAAIDLTASVVCLGPEPETQLPVMLATPHIAYIAALEAFITSVIVPGLGVPGSSAAAATAWTALLATLAPLKLKMVSTSTNSN